jgi:ribosomal protein L11 methyltransferase
MKWIEARVVFDAQIPQAASELIANLFQDLGVQGVVVDDPQLESAEDWAEDAIPRPQHHAVTGYFARTGHENSDCRQLEDRLAKLRDELGIVYRVLYQELDEEDWAESWKAFFWPVKVGRSIVVKPSWREYSAGPGEVVIELDPGMAFGTGTHPTTQLCVELIEKYIKSGDTILDVGTGSGILMVAAAKLGAARVWGVDRDPLAVEVARKNLLRNGIFPMRFAVRVGDLVHNVSGRYHVVVANILTDVILRLLDDLESVLRKDGVFIGSGIIEENTNRVEAKMKLMNLDVQSVIRRDGWVAIAGQWTGTRGIK